MRNTKRILALVLTVITLVSVVAVTAFASTEDRPLSFVAKSTVYRLVDYSRKEDSSPVYLLATSGPSPLLVKTYGCTASNPSGGENLTVARGIEVDHVTCYVGTDYSIHSDIYEEGYGYAALYIKSGSGDQGRVVGEWSPDSWLTHVDAT